MTKEFRTPRPQDDAEPTPFDSAEEAWLWFIQAQQARNDGARFSARSGLYIRPCEPADILKIVDRLYRNRRLSMDHLLVLRHYGKRQLPPDAKRVKEMRAHALWNEALERIESIMVGKGIVREKAIFEIPGRFWPSTAVSYQGGYTL